MRFGLLLLSETDATTRMAGDRSAVRVVRGHPWTQTTILEMAPGFSQSAQSRQPLSGLGPPVRQGGRWGQRRGIGRVGQPGQPNRARSPPEVAISAARQRVVQLETALAALGDTGPEVTMLQTALKRAKQAAQEPPLDVQMSLCEQFVTRAQRRLTAHDEERTRLVSELEEGQSRLARLREAATTAKEVPVPPCVIQPECGGHMVISRRW